MIDFAKEFPGWKREKCASCNGTGMVADYGSVGADFYGPQSCRYCRGTGTIWITPKGRRVAYPGGPFI